MSVANASLLRAIADNDVLRAERDQARAQRDALMIECEVLRQQRDEARALGRIA